MSAHNEEFLRCYLEELSYLRTMGDRFSQEHRKIARRLELQPDECPDPHVERLIESFAFLTARIQSDLDNDFPEIAHELLDVLYPHYLNPIPPMTIVRFDPKEKVTESAKIARGTPLFVHTPEGDVCRFRTSYDVELWPVEVVAAAFVEPSDYEFPKRLELPSSMLRLTLRSTSEPFETLGVDSLRFHLYGDMVVNRLYAPLLEGERRRVAVVPGGARTIPDLPYLRTAQVGFDDDQDVVPLPPQSHPAYRLLQEYFSFEEKFHFFDVEGLRGRASGHEIDLLFMLDRETSGRATVTPESFVLGCTPAVNLFELRGEPIRVDQRRTDYRLVADYRREKTVDIHSIRSISGSSDAAQTSREYAPYYSYTHAMTQRRQSAFWHARRVASLRASGPGTDIYLSFFDSNFDPTLPADEVVYAHLLCTNGALASEVPAGKELQSDVALPVDGIVNLRKPTRQVSPPLGGQALWRLVSHLSLNYLTLEGSEAASALREMLLLYAAPDSHLQRERIQGIRRVDSEKVVRRVPGGQWNGFARGTKVTVTFGDSLFLSSASFLFGSVLSRFFTLHGSINSFTELVVRREGDDRDADPRDRKGRHWPATIGAKAVL